MVEIRLLFIYLLIFLINKIKNENTCPKSYPIFKKSLNGCYDFYYCEEEDFKNGECIIANSIVKEQLLNDIAKFEIEDNSVYNIMPIEMPNKEIIFISFTESNESFRTLSYDILIYQLQLSGKKLISKISGFQFEGRYLSVLGVKINDKYYPLLCDINECRLLDIDNNSIKTQYFYKFLQRNEDLSDKIDYPINVINIDDKNKILFTYFAGEENHLSIININNVDLTSLQGIHQVNESFLNLTNRYSYDIECFKTKNNYIECLYIDITCYYVAIYNELLNYIGKIELDQNSIYSGYAYFERSIHVIHLKNEIGVFAYFIKDTNDQYSSSSYLRLQINELYFMDNIPQFKNVIKNTQVIDTNLIYGNIILKRMLYQTSDTISLKKINDNQFAYAYTSNANIILMIFDLYGNNYDNLYGREYKINLDLPLYETINCHDLTLFQYKEFLGISFDYYNYDFYDSTSFIIFSYPNITNNNIILNIYKLNQGFIFEPKKYFNLDNNIFGYDLNIIISSYSDSLKNIRFFSINDKKEIKKGKDLINRDDRIIFDFTSINAKIGIKNIIAITLIYSTPEFDKLSNYFDDEINYGEEDFSNFYKSKIIEEAIFTIEINFVCYESSINCDYPNLSTKTTQNDLIDLIYLANFTYESEENNLLNTYLALSDYDNSNNYCSGDIINISLYNYKNECINECPPNYYSDPLTNNCILMCQNENQYIFNSKCYDNCPEGTIPDLLNKKYRTCECENYYYTDNNNNHICLSSSMVCDNAHPILNELTNECKNYRAKYKNNGYYECPENTCISQKYESLTICEKQTSDMKVINGICFNNYLSIVNDFIQSDENNLKINEQEGVSLSIFSYDDYYKNFDEKVQNISTTMIDIRECISLYKEQYNIDEKLYISIADTPKIYSNESINRFYFELYFENMTKINVLDICEDTKMKVYSPIKNQKVVNMGKFFYDQGGYNIFNKNDKFYMDVCSGANVNDNDITLNDRYIDFYPHEIQTCPKDCQNIGINYTTNNFICECGIKLNDKNDDNNYKYELLTKDEILKYFKNFNNLFEYFSDMINYKIIKCYHLLLYPKNYKDNIGFYIGVGLFVSSMILYFIFRIVNSRNIRLVFFNHLKRIEKKCGKKNEQKKIVYIRTKNKYKTQKPARKFKSKKKKKKKRKSDVEIVDFDNSNSNSNSNSIINSISSATKSRKQSFSLSSRRSIVAANNNNENNDSQMNIMNSKEMNDLSFFKAKIFDKRKYCNILFSIIAKKIELINNIICPEDYTNRFLLFNIYFLRIYLDLLMNCLLYNDYAVSQKYHCNGHLKVITSLVISLISNCLCSLLTHYIDKLTDYPSSVETIIKEFKTTNNYLYITTKLMRYMTFQFHSLLILELVLGLFMIYYIFIFNTIYSKSMGSFLVNFLVSQFESVFYSLCISFIISFLRKISLLLKNHKIYVISVYIDEHF